MAKVTHNQRDICPVTPMVETPFFQWLRNNYDGAVFHKNLLAYFGIEGKAARGAFAGEMHYRDDDGTALKMSYLDCYRYTHEHFWRQKLKCGKEGKKITDPTE